MKELKKKNMDKIRKKEIHHQIAIYIIIQNIILQKKIIKILVGAFIFFGLHPYNYYDNYWKDDIIYENSLSKVITKNKFIFLCHCLHLPIDYNDLNCSNDDNQNDNDDIIQLEYSERKSKLEYYEQEIDPRIKVREYLEQIIMNSQNFFILGKDITIDESMVFFRGKKYALSFYIPHKPTKWGFKIHSMVDSKSNFLYDIIFILERNGKI